MTSAGAAASCGGGRIKKFMVTGQPGCGKTTLISKLCQRLLTQGPVGEVPPVMVELRGFYTEEVRRAGQRVGFDVVTVGGAGEGGAGPGQSKKVAVLSRMSGAFPPGKAPPTSPPPPTVGAYIVDVPSFEAVALPTLALPPPLTTLPPGSSSSSRTSPPLVLVIDEIGKMELFSESFKRQVSACLDHPHVIIIGSVPAPRYGREIPFVADIKARADTVVFTVRKSEREETYNKVEATVMRAITAAAGEVAPQQDEGEGEKREQQQQQQQSSSRGGGRGVKRGEEEQGQVAAQERRQATTTTTLPSKRSRGTTGSLLP